MDILVIQNAIEEYSRKYPGRPVPSAEEALAWKYGGSHKKQRKANATEERAPVRLFETLRGWWMPHRRT
jgi:hypothetical protein